jgi:hypothetical protein
VEWLNSMVMIGRGKPVALISTLKQNNIFLSFDDGNIGFEDGNIGLPIVSYRFYRFYDLLLVFIGCLLLLTDTSTETMSILGTKCSRINLFSSTVFLLVKKISSAFFGM